MTAQRYETLAREDLVRLLAKSEELLRADTEDEARRHLHDLQLHQIELELSNRELAMVQSTLEASREQFASLFDFAPVAYLRLDKSGQIVQSNLCAARLLGHLRNHLDGRPLTAFVAGASRSRLLMHLRDAFANEGITSSEFQLAAREHQGTRDLRLDSVAITAPDGLHSCLTTITDLNDLRTTERELRDSHRELESLIAAAPTGIGTVRHRVLQSLSPRLLELLGYTEQELVGKSARLLYFDDAEFKRVGRVKYEQIAAGGVGQVETVFRRHDGTRIDVLLRSAALDPADPAARTVFTVLDITEQKHTSRALEETKRMLELALSGGDIGCYSGELPHGTIDTDERYLGMLGYRPGELAIDRETWLSLIHADDRRAVEARAAPVLAGEIDSFEAEYRMPHRLGHWIWVLDRARVYERDAQTGTLRMAGTHLDITHRREAEHQVAYLVEHDVLTDLLNRRGIMRSLKTMQAQAERSGQPIALTILDLDYFKRINDAYGHPVGDEVLRSVAATLSTEVRSADWLGRWGGEEFIIAIPDSTEAKAVATVERVRERVGSKVIETSGYSIQITLSAGLAVFRPGHDDMVAAIARADTALYLAKQGGRNRIEFAGSVDGQAEISAAAVIQDAINHGKVDVCYRPIFDPRTRAIVGEEVVGRIARLPCGILDAGACRDIAMQLGVMHKIDQLVVAAAQARLTSANSERSGKTPYSVLVHLSRDLLTRKDQMQKLIDTLPTPDLESQRVGLVLTIDDAQLGWSSEKVLEVMQPLLDQGFQLGLDGFGAMDLPHRLLTCLPVSFMFIDPSLVRLSIASSRAQTVLSGIIRTVHDLDCVTIARAVDDQDSMDRLAELGVDWCQGKAELGLANAESG